MIRSEHKIKVGAKIASIMVSPEYRKARKAAYAVNNSEIATPCVKGKAVCCDNEVPITPGDRNVLLNAVETGHIPQAIIMNALLRAANEESEMCPFLDDANECSVYEYRPLVCIYFGKGAAPKRRGDLSDAVGKKRKTGVDPEFTIETCTPGMCRDCALQHDPLTRYPTSLVEKTLFVSDHIANENNAGKVELLIEFVKDTLPGTVK